MTAAERVQIEGLARDLPALWAAPQTGLAEKRQVVRLLLEQVVVWAPASSQEVSVHLHWSGGTVTAHQLTRPVRNWEQVSDAAVLWERLQGWRAEGWSSERMAEALNGLGHRTPHGKPFSAAGVRQLLKRGGPGKKSPRRTKNSGASGGQRSQKKGKGDEEAGAGSGKPR